MWLFVIHCFLAYVEYTDVDYFFFFLFFFSHEEQLCAVSLKMTFLIDGRALVPYKISEGFAAGEDANVPWKAFHSFILFFFFLILSLWKLSAYPSLKN